MGSGAFGVPTLTSLAATHDVAMVVTQPDRKAGRGGRLTPTPIGAWASEHLPGVPLVKPERVNQADVMEAVRAVETDAWVVIAFGQKLGQPLLADRFAINLHASLLPRWRGAAPINAAILGGDAVTGNSVITLAERMDAGLVLGQSERPITGAVTAGEMHDLLAGDGPALVQSVLAGHAAGTLRPVAQDESAVTLAPKLSRGDSWIDLETGASECAKRINGLSPWPGVQASLDGDGVKLLRAAAEEIDTDGTPGELLDPAAGVFATGSGGLRLLDLQPAGKRAMSWAAYARGRSLRAGAVLTSERGGPTC